MKHVMTRKAKYITLIFFVSLSTSLIGQGLDPIKPRHLKKDFETLVKAIKGHPLYSSYAAEKDLETKFDSIKNSLTSSMNQFSFFRPLAWLLKAMRGSSISIYPYTRECMDYFEEVGRLPFFIYTDTLEGFFASPHQNLTDVAIPDGAKLLAINGVPMKALFEDLKEVIPIQKGVVASTTFSNHFEYLLHHYFYPVADFTILYEFGDTSCVEIELVPNEALISDSISHQISLKLASWRPLKYNVESEGVGLITVETFSNILSPDTLYSVDTLFKTIREDSLHSLIVDLRSYANGTPEELAAFCHYLSHGTFSVVDSSVFSVSPAFRQRYLGEGGTHAKVETYKNGKLIDQERLETKSGLDGIVRRGSDDYSEQDILLVNEFEGDIYFLVDDYTGGFSSLLAAAAKYYGWGVLIGSKVPNRHCYSWRVTTELKKSNLYVSVPSQLLYGKEAESNDVVHPDIPFQESILDKLHNRDSQLEYTKAVIEKVRKIRGQKTE